jgi:hypothetical protein
MKLTPPYSQAEKTTDVSVCLLSGLKQGGSPLYHERNTKGDYEGSLILCWLSINVQYAMLPTGNCLKKLILGERSEGQDKE